MSSSRKTRRIKAGITARGFMTAVKDYTEPAVIEELAANSFDADASTVLVALDAAKQQLHIIDDGTGFSKQAIETVAVLGGGDDKREIEYSYSKRPYLGAYGFGLKSTVKIANIVTIRTTSKEGTFEVALDWKQLEDALRAEGRGFELHESLPGKGVATGTHMILDLKSPTKELLEAYHRVLGNLPDDAGKCRYYTSSFSKVMRDLAPALTDFRKLRPIVRRLASKRLASRVQPSDDPDLREAGIFEGTDKSDPTVRYKIYFTGLEGDKITPLKKGLRGIYVRIQGRLLKQSFDDQKYVYGISKWVKFAAGLRVELTIDWLRNEISLSREGLTFSNPKLEEQFRSTLARNISAFIAPQLKALEKRAGKRTLKRHVQRLELANRRCRSPRRGCLKGVVGGFVFRPETDGELALLLSNEAVIRRVNPAYRLLDYNDQADFDCIIFDAKRRENVFCELEPTLMEFLQHKGIPPDLRLIITWSLGKWRMGARKRGLNATYELHEPTPKKKGHYRLLSYSRADSRKPTRDFDVVALEDLFSVSA